MKLKNDNSISKKLISDGSTNNLEPLFSFKYFSSDKNNGIDALDLENAKQFLYQLKQLNGMTWQQIQQSHRHGLDFEKIKSIEKSRPDE